ncbi:RING finger protein 10 [Cephus cinctus]|uniref:E3 ubiquitin-protein ligase RNF10 n=1 Tax=Cephus cinctus TaxID=211228 RepID=A0AAJ7W4D4_CEPCN|nr:RING finger protein 10 [Cephus cinctus]
MEKKSCFPQSSVKGAAGDAKKNQEKDEGRFSRFFNFITDVINGKLFPKISKRREPTSTSNLPKYEQSRKSGAQKGKSFDKKPKRKGQYHGGPKEDTKVVQEEAAELGSVMVQGSKKQNLNHLLNFHYTPRDVQSGSDGWNCGRSSYTKYSNNTNRWLPPIQRHKYNKEQFLQANCQFVVTANGDYSAYLANPDTLVDWNLIEQIRVHSLESLACPICLCIPVAGKMTRCGHVYCWPCILHYLALSDKSWRKCPICYESIHKSDLKSVVEITQTALNVGDTVTLRLMRRERGSLLAMPVDETESFIPTTFFSLSENIRGSVYSKLLFANNNNVMDIIEYERVQLRSELMEDPHSPENCFIEQALNELSVRKKQILQEVESKLEKLAENQKAKRISMVEDRNANSQDSQDCQTHKYDGSTTTSLPEDDKKLLGLHSKSSVSNVVSGSDSPMTPNKFFYFYQAEDGQHVYLHAMNVKMLELQYGNLEHCPRSIIGKIVEKEAGSITEELRRRLRYLCHLPITCQIEIAEIELKPPIVSKDVIEIFHDQLETRRKRRRRREREEKKRERKITEEENRRMGKFPTPNVHIESHRHFPEWLPESQTPGIGILSPPESTTTSSVASSPSGSTLDELTLISKEPNIWPANTSDQGLSFAEMLRNPITRSASHSAWATAGTSYSSQQSRSSAAVRIRKASDSDPEAEGYISAPSYN